MPFIIKNGKQYGSSGDTSVDLTQEKYDELEAAGQINPAVTYYITDGIYSGETNDIKNTYVSECVLYIPSTAASISENTLIIGTEV